MESAYLLIERNSYGDKTFYVIPKLDVSDTQYRSFHNHQGNYTVFSWSLDDFPRVYYDSEGEVEQIVPTPTSYADRFDLHSKESYLVHDLKSIKSKYKIIETFFFRGYDLDEDSF